MARHGSEFSLQQLRGAGLTLHPASTIVHKR